MKEAKTIFVTNNPPRRMNLIGINFVAANAAHITIEKQLNIYEN
jgi:hypothetical protein